jgi:alpha-L-rhamnosidase
MLKCVLKFSTLIVMIILSALPLQILGQSQDPLLQRMKSDYQQWVSRVNTAQLFVESDPSPMALDILKPRFSWILPMEGRGKAQTGYHLIVASSLTKIDSDQGDMWDTGLINSDQSTHVRYNGKPLQSNKEYYWKVRIRDESGKLLPFGKTGIFNTGLLDPLDWHAVWIGKGDPGEIVADVDSFLTQKMSKDVLKVIPDSRSPMFRKEFRVEKKIERARIFVAGLGLYELRLNGQKIGTNVLSQSKTDFRKRILYNTYDVTKLLNEGINALGVMLGNGWFNGQRKFWGWQYQWYGSPRVILQLEIEYTDGTRSKVVTDGNWRSSWAPITFNCLFDGEHYDARLEEKNWDTPGYDQRHWEHVNIVPGPGGKLSSALHQPGKVTKVLPTLTLTEPRPDTFVFDLGQNLAGWVRLKVQGASGTKVKLKFAERLLPNGMIDPSSSRAALQEDQYTLKGDGTEIFEPRFTYHGFQYVQVTGFPGKPNKDAIEGRFAHSSVDPTGVFESSNDLINRIHYATVQSQRSNIQMGVPTDDTQRPERQGWGADALMTSQQAMLNVDIQRIYRKWFQDYRDQQDNLGRISDIVPRAGIEEDMVWSSAFVIMPWYQFLHYNDTAVLEENYHAILRYLNFLATQGRTDVKPKEAGENPLFGELKIYPHMIGYLQQSQWGDHLSLAKGFKGRSGLPLSISTAFYYHDIKVMEGIAAVLGKKEDQKLLGSLSQQVLQAFNQKFYNRQPGYYDDRSQAAQTWPLFFGMVPKDSEDAVFKWLITDIVDSNKVHPTTGYVGTKYLIDLLTMKGRQDLVWEMAMKKDFPSWSYFLRDGRTTITESWAGGGSQNHVVLGSAIDPWFYTVLAGINTDERAPGFKQFTIKPYIPEHDLDWVKSSVETVHGTIKSAWQKKGQGLTLEFTVPANTKATIHIPSASGAIVTEKGVSIDKVAGIKMIGSNEKSRIVEAGSGSYSFDVSIIK